MISEVYNIDCLIYMRTLPDKFFDLAIVDPPYGINADLFSNASSKGKLSTAKKLRKGRLNSGGGKLKNRALNTLDASWDSSIPDAEYFTQLERISKNRIIWGGNYFPLPPTRGIVVWDKIQCWENFSQVELAWTSFDCPAKLYRQRTTGGANREKKISAAQKPINLYKWLLHSFAKKGNKIFDSHLGSQSSRIAAHDMGFDFYGCEKDATTFAAGNKRYVQHTSQQRIFN